MWLARSALGAYRAVKVIHRSQFDHERPYERELRAIREVEPFTRQHEGLVDILQVGQRENYFYYVMELADDLKGKGELDPETYQPRTLTMELYERERLPPETTCSLGVTIAKALAFLHENNLVHRDVKLSNIIYVKGQAKLADVGLVTRSDASFSLVGTYGYIPREGPGRPSADIYALGKVLYEAATGKDRADFPEIDVMDPALKGLNRVFLKACVDEPDDRYASAGLMADELEGLIQNDQEVENVSPPRSSYKTGALAASLLLILALIFYSKDDKGNNTASSDSSLDGDKGTDGTDFANKGLVAYYPFNGNAEDESGNGNDGEIKGAKPCEDRFGRPSRAYSFDGIDDRISVPDDDTLDFGNEHPGWTISAWVLSEGANAYGTEGGQIVGKYWRDGSPGIDYGLLRYKKQNGTIAYQMGLKTDADGGGGWTESDLPVNLDGVGWHHIVATVDLEGKIKKLYYNGTLFDSVNLTLPKNPSHNAELLIGNGPHSSGRNLWKGKLDDIRIYNRALSGQQVKVLYDLN